MKFILLYTFVFLSLFSCKKVLLEEVPDTTPTSLFEQAWEYTNETYSFFNFKGIDWDSVKTVYGAKVNDAISEDSLFTVLGDMLYTLRDGHVNLTSDFDRSRNWNWFLDYPQNYDENLLLRDYFKDKQQFVGPFTVMDFGDVGYVYYGSFSLSVTEKDMQIVLDKFRNHKGLILDVRDNGGGSISNVFMIADHFVNQKETVALSRIKSGPGKDDFTQVAGYALTPVEGNVTFDKPVILLTNRKCYSATNMLRTMMGSLSNVIVVGDRTGGGGGIPSYTQLSNGWGLRVSSSQTFTIGGLNNEDGLEPDTKINMSTSDQAIGLDSILEEALRILRN